MTPSLISELEKAMEDAPGAGHNQLIAKVIPVLPQLLAAVRAAEKVEGELLTEPLLHGDQKHREWLVGHITRICTPLRQALSALGGTGT